MAHSFRDDGSVSRVMVAQFHRTHGSRRAKYSRYAFVPEDNTMPLFWMAAIYQQVEGKDLPVFTILTMEASVSVAPIHNRMPVIWKNREAQIAWIKGNGNIEELIHEETVKEIGCKLVV